MHDAPHITLKYSESDVLRSVSNDVVKFDNIKHLSMYIQEEKKLRFSYLSVMLDLHVTKIIAYLIERILLFLYPSCFPIQAIQETSILEEVIKKILPYLSDTIPVRSSHFLLI